MSVADLERLVSRLEAVAGKLESSVPRGGGGGSGGNAPIDDDPEWHDDFVKMYDSEWKKFVADSKAIGDDVGKHAELVQKAFEAHKTLMLVAARFNAPAQKDVQTVVKSLSEGISAVQTFRESNRASKQYNFLSAISEGIPFLGWVVIAPKPAAYVSQMEESAQFFTNKVLKEFRQSNPKLADWSNSWIKLLKNFQAYIKDQHTVGLKWNKDKPAATPASLSQVSSGAPRAPGAPPPPPGPPAPPPPGPPPPSSAKSEPAAPDTSALFKALNKGNDITKGLKKVTSDMQTHKNPALKQVAKSDALSPRPYSPPQFKKFTAPGGPKPEIAKKPPVFELQSKKWVVEFQEGNQQMIIDDCSTEQTVYMYKCTNSVLQVKGKINSITLDGCKKCGIIFEDLISTCEFINCQSVKAQANGNVPTISVDKTDGAQIYLNDKSKNCEIISAKSSEMNVCITKEDGDLTEYPLAEQFKSVWNGKGYTTTTLDINA